MNQNEHRIPPSVTFQFEKVLALAAEHARLDATEWAVRSHELMGQLEYRWREGIDIGLSTEQAEKRALELFGDPVAVGRRFRRKWEFKLIFSSDWRLARIGIFLTATFLAGSLISSAALTFELKQKIREAVNDIGSSIETSLGGRKYKPLKLLSNYERFMTVIHSKQNWIYMNSGLAVAAPFFLSLLRANTGLKNYKQPIAFLLMLPVAAGATFVAIIPIVCAKHQISESFSVFSVTILICRIGLGALGAACLLSDVFDLPTKQKRSLLKILGYQSPH